MKKKNHLLIIFARFYLFRARIRYRQEPRGFQIINREGGMIVLSLNPVEAHHSNYISCQYICCLYSSKSHKSWSYLKKVFKKWISYVKLYIGIFSYYTNENSEWWEIGIPKIDTKHLMWMAYCIMYIQSCFTLTHIMFRPCQKGHRCDLLYQKDGQVLGSLKKKTNKTFCFSMSWSSSLLH